MGEEVGDADGVLVVDPCELVEAVKEVDAAEDNDGRELIEDEEVVDAVGLTENVEEVE
jgi:hypothetical protein